MKILFTYYLPSGGVDTLNRTRCRALMRAGIEAHLLYLRDGAGRQNIKDIPLFLSNLDHEIQPIIASQQYDVIMCTSDYHMLSRLRSMGYGGLLIFEAQGLGMYDQAREAMNASVPNIRSYANAAMCTPTPHLIELYQEFLPDFPRFYVQNAVDTEVFSAHPASLPPADLGSDSDGPILAWVGRMERNKNWQLFIETAAELVKTEPRLRLWMFEDANLYDPQERALFHQLTTTYQLWNRLTLRSNIPHEQMAHYFAAVGHSGGLLFSTSHVEGFGYAVAEALSCHCPVLATDSDGVRFFIEHNRTGKLIAQHISQWAAAEALELMQDAALRLQIREQGAQHIRQHFSPERYTQDMINVFRALGLPL